MALSKTFFISILCINTEAHSKFSGRSGSAARIKLNTETKELFMLRLQFMPSGNQPLLARFCFDVSKNLTRSLNSLLSQLLRALCGVSSKRASSCLQKKLPDKPLSIRSEKNSGFDGCVLFFGSHRKYFSVRPKKIVLKVSQP